MFNQKRNEGAPAANKSIVVVASGSNPGTAIFFVMSIVDIFLPCCWIGFQRVAMLCGVIPGQKAAAGGETKQKPAREPKGKTFEFFSSFLNH